MIDYSDDWFKQLTAGLDAVDAIKALIDNGELNPEMGQRFIEELTAKNEEQNR